MTRRFSFPGISNLGPSTLTAVRRVECPAVGCSLLPDLRLVSVPVSDGFRFPVGTVAFGSQFARWASATAIAPVM